jgi:hypothetical protein
MTSTKYCKMKNLFDKHDYEETLQRIDNLKPDSQAQWGKMSVDQMLAHCNVAYDMAYTEKYPKATGLKRWMLKMFVKSAVVGPKPYPKNGRTAPVFIISDERDFETEKTKLVNHLKKTFDLGAAHFENRESNSFGRMTSAEWNVSFSKHLDHHLKQFGV